MTLEIRGHHLENLFWHIKRGRPESPFDQTEEYLLWEGILNHPLIKIVEELDFVCLKCPSSNQGENLCERYEDGKLAKLDREIARLAGLQVGRVYSSKFLRDRLGGLSKLYY